MNQSHTDESKQANQTDQEELQAEAVEEAGMNEDHLDQDVDLAGETNQEAESEHNINDLLQQLEAAHQQIEEAQQRTLRSQADFDNFRRRTRQEKEQLTQYASMNVLEQILPVIDNFERAIASSVETKDFDSLAKGIEMVFRQMMSVLENEGLKSIDAIGAPFNPEFHQAVMQVQSDEHEEGTVVEELQKGYMLKEKILRPSMVKVSS